MCLWYCEFEFWGWDGGYIGKGRREEGEYEIEEKGSREGKGKGKGKWGKIGCISWYKVERRKREKRGLHRNNDSRRLFGGDGRHRRRCRKCRKVMYLAVALFFLSLGLS